MPNAARRATATALPEATAQPDAEILALAAEFEALLPKISSLETRIAPLVVAFGAISKRTGSKRLRNGARQSEHDALITELNALFLRETDLVDSMIKLQPKTPAGIAAVAAAFKADQDHFWKEPEPDRDWGNLSLNTVLGRADRAGLSAMRCRSRACGSWGGGLVTSANNRRAVPGAVLAGATIGETALPALAAPAPPELSAVDPRVLDLWGLAPRVKQTHRDKRRQSQEPAEQAFRPRVFSSAGADPDPRS
jgi:hypothetical protein